MKTTTNDGRPRILVVEDEAHLAEGLLLNLDAEGYHPILARDGMEALERVADRAAAAQHAPKQRTGGFFASIR